MHAYLIIGNNDELNKIKAQEIAIEKRSILIDQQIEKIEDVRNLSAFIKLKRSENSTFFIKDIDKASTESLNAFLKILEEPKGESTFILTSISENLVLPTIVSRAQIIRLTNSENKNLESYKSEVDKFLNNTKIQNLDLIKQFKNKDDAKNFLQLLIYKQHLNLNNSETKSKITTAKKIEMATEALNRINKNSNSTIQLINFVINS